MLSSALNESHRSAPRLFKLQQAEEALQLLLARERSGLCTSCARVSLERNRSLGRQVVATAIGTALGMELHQALRPLFASPLTPTAAAKDDAPAGGARGGRG